MKKKIIQHGDKVEMTLMLQHIWNTISNKPCPNTISEYVHEFGRQSFANRMYAKQQYFQLKTRPFYNTAEILNIIEKHMADIFSITCAIKKELGMYPVTRKTKRQFDRTFQKNEEAWAESDKLLQHVKSGNEELFWETIVDRRAEEIPYTFNFTNIFRLFEAHDFQLN